jgi:hypothetical protein
LFDFVSDYEKRFEIGCADSDVIAELLSRNVSIWIQIQRNFLLGVKPNGPTVEMNSRDPPLRGTDL